MAEKSRARRPPVELDGPANQVMTAEQTAEFLAAYRKTFMTKEAHGRALAALCVKYAQRFSVRPDILRTLASEDLAKNRKKYGKLRSQFASLQNADRPAINKPISGKRRRKKPANDPVNRALPASTHAATTGRLDDTAKSSPKGVRKVIGGGSPGLGKNAK